MIRDLRCDLATHWNATDGRYDAILEPMGSCGTGLDAGTIMAAVYGASPINDPRMMATFAALADDAADRYPINKDDFRLGMGPMLGRYPGDTYDGDAADPNIGDPWALCTLIAAEYLYRLASDIHAGGLFRLDTPNAKFYGRVGVSENSTPDQVVDRLTKAADRMLDAVLRHADQLHLSEQFDLYTGYEKSVRDLTWSYASFASAVRARRTIRSVP